MDESRQRRESVLSVAAKWLPWCLGLVFALTIGWTIFVARVEILNADGRSSEEIAVAIVTKTADTLPLIVLCSLFVTTVLDLSGGAFMVTARYLTDKFLEPWREKRKAEAVAEIKAEIVAEIKADMATRIPAEVKAEIEAQGMARGLAQKQSEWEAWLRDKEDAAERGEPFDDPPPSL